MLLFPEDQWGQTRLIVYWIEVKGGAAITINQSSLTPLIVTPLIGLAVVAIKRVCN
jgi:hypothetical protein